MEVFLARIRQLLPVLGSDILAPIAQPAAKAQPGGVLFCRNKGATSPTVAMRLIRSCTMV